MRLLRTIRYLRLEQFFGRLWFKLYHPTPDLSPAPICAPLQVGGFILQSDHLLSLGPGLFVF